MDITVQASVLPDDPDAAPALYRDLIGFEVRNDVGYSGLRWITGGLTEQPDTTIAGLPIRL